MVSESHYIEAVVGLHVKPDAEGELHLVELSGPEADRAADREGRKRLLKNALCYRWRDPTDGLLYWILEGVDDHDEFVDVTIPNDLVRVTCDPTAAINDEHSEPVVIEE